MRTNPLILTTSLTELSPDVKDFLYRPGRTKFVHRTKGPALGEAGAHAKRGGFRGLCGGKVCSQQCSPLPSLPSLLRKETGHHTSLRYA